MSSASDFVIENGVLEQYIGSDEHVVIPDGVTAIEGQPAFNKCKNVKSITVPASVREFTPTEFYYLKKLEWIECLGEVEITEDYAFPGCKNLVYLVCNPNTPLSAMPSKWKQALAIGAAKCLADGHELSAEARREVSKYIAGQNKKLGLYKIAYSYPFFAKYLINEKLLSEELYDEMIAFAQENRITDVAAMLIEGKSRQYPSETYLERAEKKIDQEIAHAQKMDDHSSTTYLKTQWSWEKRADGTLMITSYKGTDPEVFIPSVVGKNKVTAIRGHLFMANTGDRDNWLRTKLKTVHIAEGISEVGGGTMQDGPISHFAVPTHFYLPQSITSICRNAFAAKKTIKGRPGWEYVIENVIFHVPAGSFAEQYAKDNGIPYIIESESSDEIRIPDGYECFPEEMFRGNAKLTELTIPETVKSIGPNAFSECSTLKRIVIPESVTEIALGAFSGCAGLTEAVLPETLRTISAKLFSGCSSLISVNIPSQAENIGTGAFKDCSSLSEVKLPDALTSIEPSAFQGCSSLRHIRVPAGVATIGIWAFRDCPNLTIHAPAGSAAEKYANKNGIPFAAE